MPELDISEEQIKSMSQEQINILVIKNLIEIKRGQKPMEEAFNTARTLGKWIMGFLVFLSVTIGVIMELRNLIKVK